MFNISFRVKFRLDNEDFERSREFTIGKVELIDNLNTFIKRIQDKVHSQLGDVTFINIKALYITNNNGPVKVFHHAEITTSLTNKKYFNKYLNEVRKEYNKFSNLVKQAEHEGLIDKILNRVEICQ